MRSDMNTIENYCAVPATDHSGLDQRPSGIRRAEDRFYFLGVNGPCCRSAVNLDATDAAE